MDRWGAARARALGPMVIAAVDQCLPTQERVVHDRLVLRLLPRGARLAVGACRVGAVRAWAVRAGERRAPGVWAAALCRRRFGDDVVARAVAEGIGQVVVLGAGLDTRACRLVVPAGVPAFEVDGPGAVVRKRLRLKRALGRVPVGLRLVAVGADARSLAAGLEAAGYRSDRSALFVWEGAARRPGRAGAVLGVLESAAPGSGLVLWGGPGAEAGRVGAVLAGSGWCERERLRGPGYAERYLRAAGREGLAVRSAEWSLYAVKRAR
ncbi:class I SAM-dependent methyltransferase [Nocardiopsis baichengensis]|uniref:class I SAM-dependent methyltransferase n=1 Tax=Nocardiopsis baichengensis TaxID=280240 RepID=UPI0005929723|nr:class I SAM-dependent methyltransferase [Nocardiopsis baichengensis]